MLISPSSLVPQCPTCCSALQDWVLWICSLWPDSQAPELCGFSSRVSCIYWPAWHLRIAGQIRRPFCSSEVSAEATVLIWSSPVIMHLNTVTKSTTSIPYHRPYKHPQMLQRGAALWGGGGWLRVPCDSTHMDLSCGRYSSVKITGSDDMVQSEI